MSARACQLLSRLFSLIAIGCFALCVHACLAGGDDTWKKRFFAEAPRKWAEYLSRCERFQGSGSFSHVDMLAGEKWVEKGAYEFKQNPDCGCALFGGVVEDIAGERHSLRCINSRYVFELFGRPWVLDHWEPLSEKEGVPSPRASVEQRTREALHFMYTDQQLSSLITQPEFTVHSVTPMNLGEREFAKVEFAYRPEKADPPKLRLTDGWVLLDPQRYWVINNYQVSVVRLAGGKSWKGSMVGTYEYEEGVAGIPIPKRLVIRNKQVDDNGKADDFEMRHEFKIVEAEVPESEFLLSAFGLPEPVEPVALNSQKPMPPYLWVLIGVGTFAMLAVGFRYLARRRGAAGA